MITRSQSPRTRSIVHSVGSGAALALIAATLSLAGCGGGDSSPAAGEIPSPVPPNTPPPPPPPPPPAATVTASDACMAVPAATGAEVPGTLTANARSTQGAVTFSLVSQPTRGTVTLTSAGTYTYRPKDSGRGYADSFRFRATDAQGGTAEAKATVVYGTARIMPLGDSITEGVESVVRSGGNDVVGPDSASRVAYRKRLVELLTAGGYAHDMVGEFTNGAAAGLTDAQHEGWAGRATQWVADGIAGYLGAQKPDVVLLHIGTNDNTTAATAMQSLLTNANGWAGANQPVRLLLAKIINHRPDASNTLDVAALNANVTNLYNSNWADSGSNPAFTVRLVDMFSAINVNTDLTAAANDYTGLHPNAAGYAKMAQVWFDGLVTNGFVNRCP